MGLYFVLLARCTSFYVFRNPLIHAVPCCHCPCFLDCFITSWVPCCGVIVRKEHDGPFHFRGHGLFWNDRGDFVFFQWYDYLLLVIVFSLVNSRRAQECIWGDVFFARDMSYFVVVLL